MEISLESRHLRPKCIEVPYKLVILMQSEEMESKYTHSAMLQQKSRISPQICGAEPRNIMLQNHVQN